ncbi:MAG: hypothetical protein V3W34_18815 [Phycisphaerae bacterium]
MNTANGFYTRCLIIGAVSACATVTRAQWIEQTFTLAPGWNTVYLEVDPVPAEADVVFAGQPITGVWMRAPGPSAGVPEGCTNPSDPACTPVHSTG